MAALRITIRSSLRRGWLGALALALLVGIAGGAVLTAWAGARRTASAFTRLQHAVHAADVTVAQNLDVTSGATGAADFSDLATLPGVARAGQMSGFGLTAWTGGPPSDDNFDAYAVAPRDEEVGRSFDGPLVLDGRLPAAGAADEVVMNDAALRGLNAQGFDARVGGRVPLAWFNFSVMNAAGQRIGDRQPTSAELAEVFHAFDARIVGRVRLPEEIVANENQDISAILLSPAFARAHSSDASFSVESIALRDQSDLPGFEDAARARHPGTSLRFSTPADAGDAFDAAVGPYVDTLHLFALIVAATAFLVLAQALVRQARAAAGDAPTLQALGLPRRHVAAGIATRGMLTVGVAVVIAISTAVVASRWFPLGAARPAEPAPGVDVDAVVLAVGVLVVVVALGLTVAIASLRAVPVTRDATARTSRPRPGHRVDLVTPTVPSTIGVAHAFDRRSRVSVGATLTGVIIAIATCTAALGFGAAIDRLVSRPAHWGWHWNALYDTYESRLNSATVKALDSRPEITGLTVGARGTVRIGGTSLAALGLNVRRGSAYPETISGRLPREPDEIAFGGRTLRALGVSVGDRISGRDAQNRPVSLSVVGEVVVPPSLDLSENHRLGESAVLTLAGLAEFDPHAPTSFALVNYRDSHSATLAAVDKSFSDSGSFLDAQRPSEITSYERLRATPLILAALLGLLAVGVLGHALVSSVRARRKEHAVLKALGFVRLQVASVVVWEATVLVVVASVIGITLGVGASRVVWRRFVDDLGVQSASVVPVLALFGLVLVLLALANAIAALPARRAARLAPATALRSE
jgi:ABC-type lipoprotein release transport system permease subunit